jgi:hypothetical protein
LQGASPVGLRRQGEGRDPPPVHITAPLQLPPSQPR